MGSEQEIKSQRRELEATYCSGPGSMIQKGARAMSSGILWAGLGRLGRGGSGESVGMEYSLVAKTRTVVGLA